MTPSNYDSTVNLNNAFCYFQSLVDLSIKVSGNRSRATPLVVKVSKAGESCLIKLRCNDLYLIGWQGNKGQWVYFNEHSVLTMLKDQYRFNANAGNTPEIEILPEKFNGSYHSLGGLTGLRAVTMGDLIALCREIKYCSLQTGAITKQKMVKILIVFICEALRFSSTFSTCFDLISGKLLCVDFTGEYAKWTNWKGAPFSLVKYQEQQ